MKKMVSILFLLPLLSLIMVHTDAQVSPEQLQKKVISTIEIRKKTQEKEDDWAGKKAKLIAQYRSLKAEAEHLKKVRIKTEELLKAKRDRVLELKRRIKESARIRKELGSYLESVVIELEEFIKNDLPFLLKERFDRIGSIKHLLAQPDKPAAEKYRRVMEALQVETEYGQTVEVYQENIKLNGKPLLVDVLRLGRLSLFFQTPDGKVIGHFDRATGKWALLPSKYRSEINKAVEIANRQRAIELVKLPIGRIVIPQNEK